jgi:hypothetical protein
MPDTDKPVQSTTAKVTVEQAREDEDTHQWIARLHRENAQKAAQACPAPATDRSSIPYNAKRLGRRV